MEIVENMEKAQQPRTESEELGLISYNIEFKIPKGVLEGNGAIRVLFYDYPPVIEKWKLHSWMLVVAEKGMHLKALRPLDSRRRPA